MAVDRLKLICTISGALRLGSTCRRRMRASPLPRTRADCTNSVSLSDSTLARVRRAKAGAYTMPIARMALPMPVPSTAMMPIASRMAGKANSTSMLRMMTASDQPPKNPAISPDTPPATSAKVTEMSPTSSEIWAPYMMRLRMSRPNSSVPSRKYSLGGYSFQLGWVSSGP